MLSLDAVGVLFPAIPLAIVALNFRYTSLAGLMRELHAQLDKKKTTENSAKTSFIRGAGHNGSENEPREIFSVFLGAIVCIQYSDIVCLYQPKRAYCHILYEYHDYAHANRIMLFLHRDCFVNESSSNAYIRC